MLPKRKADASSPAYRLRRTRHRTKRLLSCGFEEIVSIQLLVTGARRMLENGAELLLGPNKQLTGRRSVSYRLWETRVGTLS
jgi:hypothetical protein